MRILLEVETGVNKSVRVIGWTCPRESCHAFNGEEKERLAQCRACTEPRPDCEVNAGSAAGHTCVMISEVAR